jgi:hypothetical protein
VVKKRSSVLAISLLSGQNCGMQENRDPDRQFLDAAA